MKPTDDTTFDAWYNELNRLAVSHDETGSEPANWHEYYLDGYTPAEAFYHDYPEHKD